MLTKQDSAQFVKDVFDVEGKVAVITGGGRGIGLEMAKTLAGAGAHVVLASRTQSELDSAVNSLSQYSGRAVGISTDVTIRESVERLAEQTLERFGKIDILINNAGVNIRKPFLEFSDQDWEQVLNTNLRGVFICSQVIGKTMVKRRSGIIINTSSGAGRAGVPYLALYCASKGGINQITKTLAAEWAEYNIRVNAIAPNYIKTAFTADWLEDKSRLELILARTPMRRLGKLSELQGITLFLASEASSYVTGQIFYIDGGISASSAQ